MLRNLEGADRLVEDVALLGIGHGQGEGAPGHADRRGGGEETLPVDRFERLAHSPVHRAEDGVGCHDHVVEEDLAGRMAADPEGRDGLDAQALRRGGDEEHGDPVGR